MTIKIQYISDIHLEFRSKLPKIKPNADILVLAGDIGDPYTKIYKWLLNDVSIKFKKIFIIPGNHEYYNDDNDIDQINNYISNLLLEFPNITFLYDSYEDYNGYRFIGSVLWSRITNPCYLTNDFKYIKNISIFLFNELHNISKEFIKEAINSSELPIIMITHFIPSFNFIINDKYAQCFASNCDELFNSKIKLWIYGHTHHNNYIENYKNVKFVCNPLGYPSEKALSNYNLIVDIDNINLMDSN